MLRENHDTNLTYGFNKYEIILYYKNVTIIVDTNPLAQDRLHLCMQTIMSVLNNK